MIKNLQKRIAKASLFAIIAVAFLFTPQVSEAYLTSDAAPYCNPGDPAGYQYKWCYDYNYGPGGYYYYNQSKITDVRIFVKGTESDVSSYSLYDKICPYANSGTDYDNFCYAFRTKDNADIDPAPMKIGVTYTIKFTVLAHRYYTQFSRYQHARVYIDVNNDKEFDTDLGGLEFPFEWSGELNCARDGKYTIAAQGGIEGTCAYNSTRYTAWNYWNCSWGYNQQYNPTSVYGAKDWKELEFDYTLPCNGVSPGETRMRIMTEYYNYSGKNTDPCVGSQNYRGLYLYAYMGQTVDYTIDIQGVEMFPFPSKGGTVFADESYDGGNRKAKIYPNGPNMDFPLPSVTFPSDPANGTYMKYWIVGPSPSKTVVYRAAYGPNPNDYLIPVGPNDVGNYGVTKNSNDEIVWTANYKAQYEDPNGSWVRNGGALYGNTAGEYTLAIQFLDESGEEGGCSDPMYFPFTFMAENDMTVSQIDQPKTELGDFMLYGKLLKMPVGATYRNIGLNKVSQFAGKAEIYELDANGDAGDLVYEGESSFAWDEQNEDTKLESGESVEVDFPAFKPLNVGRYCVRMSVLSIDGDLDKDDEPFNDFFPRPTGGNKKDGWEFTCSEYVIRVAERIDLVAQEVVFPLPVWDDTMEPRAKEDEIIVNRPFFPVAIFRNDGLDDAVSDGVTLGSDLNITATCKIYESNANKDKGPLVEELSTKNSIEDIPSGRNNTRKVVFEEVSLPAKGYYIAEYEISFKSGELESSLWDNNDMSLWFEVGEGLQGVYTVGLMNETGDDDRNFPTIESAMADLYYLGVSGDITFKLTDETYNLNGNPAWDFSSRIIGIGMPDNSGVVEMLWTIADNRAMVKNGVTINMTSFDGIGVKFGQALRNNSSVDAAINKYTDPANIYSAGYITMDGGKLNSLRFSMSTINEFSAPIYLGQGTQNVTLRNLVVENAELGNPAPDRTDGLNQIHPPRIVSQDAGTKLTFEPDEAISVDLDGNVLFDYTYTAGIVNRGRLFDPEELADDEDFVNAEINIVPNAYNTIEGCEISGFGYGILALGMGPIYDGTVGVTKFINQNNHDNLYKNNIITNVGRAGIAIGNEDNSIVYGNIITNVNPEDGMMDNTENGNGSGIMNEYDAAGIMIGGIVYEESGNEAFKGYHTSGMVINANRISGVNSSKFATGISVEQNMLEVGQVEENVQIFPESEEATLVMNNVVMGINATSSEAGKAGIRMFTQRETSANDLVEDMITQDQEFYFYKSSGDKVYNNTVLLGDDNVANDGPVFGIGVQNTEGASVYNNIVAITDTGIPTDNNYASAIFVQGLLPEDGGPSIDNNAYHIATGSGAVLVKLVETDPKDDGILHDYDRDDFVNHEQWRIWTGSDKNSIEADFMNDLVISSDNILVKMTNGKYPKGSVLNNRGRRLDDVYDDVAGTSRGITGQRYDIGAHEFKGELYTADLQMVRVDSPASYKAAVPKGDFDLTGEEHIMTTSPINVTARVRNDGALLQAGVELNATISVIDPMGEESVVVEEVGVANVGSTEFGIVDFKLNDGAGVEFMPMTYAEHALAGNVYDMDAPENVAYKGMTGNVTPPYMITIKTSADENNTNNTTTKSVRFFLKKSELDMIVSSKFNSTDIYVESDADKVGGALNLTQLRSGMDNLGWELRPDYGTYDYDLFDRSGWEPRAVSYGLYGTMIWSDGGADVNDVLTRIETDEMEEFLTSQENGNKRNLVMASQDLARFATEEFNTNIIHVEYDGNPLGNGMVYMPADPDNDPAYTVTGTEIAKNHIIDITEPDLSNDDSDLYPRPSALKLNNKGGVGTAKAAMTYDNVNSSLNQSEIMGVVTTSQDYNIVYFGVEWRHFDDIATVMAGVKDFLNANGDLVVPISSIELDAVLRANKVTIDWETVGEDNDVSSFAVEKSIVNETGISTFAEIANVDATGTDGVHNYGPVLDSEISSGNKYIYRVAVQDLDGNSVLYSNEVEITTESMMEILTVKDGVIYFNADDAEQVHFSVYDMSGSLVSEVNANSGSTQTNLGMTNVSTGTYHVVMTVGDNTVTRKFNVID